MARKIMIPKQGEHRKDAGLDRKIYMVIALVIIIVVVISTALILTFPRDDPSAAISRVEIYPVSPQSGNIITITAFLDGNLSLKKPQFRYHALFYSGMFVSGDEPVGGSHPMTRISGEEYSIEVGPYPEGVQIWYMIFLPTSNGISYNEGTINIGNVQYDDGITIHEPYLTPTILENTMSIQVTANMSINRVITESQMTYWEHLIISPTGRCQSVGETISSINHNYTTQTSQYIYTIRYTQSITAPNEPPEYEPFPSGTLIFYRISISGENYQYATPSYIIQIP